MDYQCKNPVLIIFFNRPETLTKVFEQVRKAKPKRLILAQDGPRNIGDKERIMECRRIVENIDWECEVTREYSEINLGCGMRPQTAITKSLELYETIIILEDDCVPTESFFQYCDEMLEKYKDDERVAYISGLNHFGDWECGDSDYFFTKTGAIHGWATWRRVWSKYYDYYVESIKDDYSMRLIQNQFTNKTIAKSRIKNWERANLSRITGEKLSYWDNQWGFVKYSQSMLVITPRINQIMNIGGGADSTHAQSLKNTQFMKGRNFIYIPTKNFVFPIKSPKTMICDLNYDNAVYKIIAGSKWRQIASKIKHFLKFSKKH